MSTAMPPSPADAILANAIAAERSSVVDGLGSRPTIWLAVVPLWTLTVAEAVGFPVDSVTGFVTQARRIGWCETRGSLRRRGPGELRFWMPDQTRRDVIDVLSRLVGNMQLLQEAARIAALVAAHPDPGSVPGALRDWAGLMTDAVPEAALVDRVRLAVEAGDLSGAQQLVAVGQALAPVLAGAAELAVDRASRLMNLGVRRRWDSRSLDRYLDRPALSDAVSVLLRPDAERWALHLRGVGGVGKTMLIRYLASGRYAADHGARIVPMARADFDHISADYPVRRPVQLLLELADELALHTAGDTGADRALSSFRAAAVSAHEALSGQREGNPRSLENPLVLRAIEAFAQALERLPGTLLILDTCEELAKADAGDPVGPAVRATFGIIELLHELAPATRVLLAGRRALPPHDYLAVTDVAGFTVEEATRYLTTFADRPLETGLLDAIIRQSAAVDAAVPEAGALPDGVSPFDLALYLSWADEDPDLDEQRIAVGSDAYVEGRIIARLGDPLVLEALPALAALGRCRVHTLEALVPGDSPPSVGARLAEQEWVDADGDPPVHLTVQPALARRLRRYFSAPDREAEFTATTARLAGALRSRLTASPLTEIDIDELLAALRLSEPAAAADLWDDIVRRAEAPPGRWGWVLNVADRVLGESDEECWPTADALLATVTAAWIAASRRAYRSFDPTESWNVVRASAGHHPDRDMARVLRARAALGLLPGAASDETLWTDLQYASVLPDFLRQTADAVGRVRAAGDFRSLARFIGEGQELIQQRRGYDAWRHARNPLPVSHIAALAATAVNAVDRLLEAGDASTAYRLTAGELFDAALAGAAGVRLQAWALVVLCRQREADWDLPEALAAAESVAKAAGEESAWADWIPPENLLARIRIERGLLGPPDTGTLEMWESYAAADIGSIDRERLASLCLRVRLGEGALNQAEIERWESLDVYQPGRLPACSAHDVIPPLFVTLAEAELAAGRPDLALDLVARRRTEALNARQEQADDPTLRAADAETVRLARRFRLYDQRAALTRLANPRRVEPSQLDLRDAARRAMAILYGEQPRTERKRPAGWHAWWQCQKAPLSGPLDSAGVRWLNEPTDAEHADIELDLEEVRLLSDPALADLERELADWLARPERQAAPVRSADLHHDARVALRRHALTGQSHQLPSEVPIRNIAEMAFDEAELLALRLPVRAVLLYRIAADAYDRLPDAAGRLMALAAMASVPGEREEFRDAVADVRRTHPDVVARLTGPPDEAGPWSHWASVTRQLVPPAPAYQGQPATPASPAAPQQPQTQTATPAPATTARRSRAPAVTALAGLVAVTLVGVVTAVLALRGGPTPGTCPACPPPKSAPGLSGWLIMLIVLGALLVAGVGLIPEIRRVRRLADGQGVRTLRPGSLCFRARVWVGEDGGTHVQLLAEPRLVGDAPRWQWPRLALIRAEVRLARALRRTPPAGYRVQLGNVTLEPAPGKTNRWWSRGAGTPGGVIDLDREPLMLPWERILAASLGPGAAGRVEWVRHLRTSAAPYAARQTIRIGAPSAWRRNLERVYEGADSAHSIMHGVGRAVITSAGPRLDVSGEATAGGNAADLLDVQHLVADSPVLVVLQAEPTDVAVDPSLTDDLLERLTLAVDLIEAGVPAVLIVPTLPADLLPVVTGTVAELGGSARQVLARLRRELGQRVEPAVLDEIVLFVNPRGEQ